MPRQWRCTRCRGGKAGFVPDGGAAALNPAALFLPELRGYGNLPNLSIAMSLDTALLEAAQDFASQPLADIAQNLGPARAAFDELLFRWAGVQAEAPESRGPFLADARALSFMEKMRISGMCGRWWRAVGIQPREV